MQGNNLKSICKRLKSFFSFKLRSKRNTETRIPLTKAEYLYKVGHGGVRTDKYYLAELPD